MKTAAATDNLSLIYVIAYTTVVDRPEKRTRAQSRVMPGTIVQEQLTIAEHKAALRMLEAILIGALDFRSEYVASVRVFAHNMATDETWNVRATRERAGRHAPWVETDRVIAPANAV